MVVEDLRGQMTQAKAGAPMQRKAMMLLQGIPRRAVVRGLMPVTVSDWECRDSLQIPRVDDAGLEPATSALSRRTGAVTG